MIGSRPALFPVWHLAGSTMLHFIWAGSLVAVLAALGRQLLRRAHPDVRYALALQRGLESALFFHAAVWVLSGWVRREREHCCDQTVVQHIGRALDYAGAVPASRRHRRPGRAGVVHG